MNYSYSNEDAKLLSRVKLGFVSILVKYQSCFGTLELNCGSGFIVSIENSTITVLTEDHLLYFHNTKNLIDAASLETIEFFSYSRNKRIKIGEKKNLDGVAYFTTQNTETRSRVISIQFSLLSDQNKSSLGIQSLKVADSHDIFFGAKVYIIKYSVLVYEKSFFDDTLYLQENNISGIQQRFNSFTVQDNDGLTFFSQKKDSGGPVFNSNGDILGIVWGGARADKLGFHITVCDLITADIINSIRQQGKPV